MISNNTSKFLLYLLLASALLVSVSLCGCTSTSTGDDPGKSANATALMVYCGAGLNEPMDEIASAYEQKTGVKIEYTYGGCGALLSQMELTKKGDVFVPGSQDDADMAKNKSFMDETTTVVYHIPVIAVQKGNPKNVTCLSDLARPGLKVVLGDNQTNAIGKLGDKMFEKNKVKDGIEKNVVARSATVNELVTYITTGQADATVIWEDLYVPDKMDVVSIPVKQNIIKTIPVGVLTFSENKDEAQKFVDFIASDEGKAIFEKDGFVTYPDPRYS
jgi:molybdate transport system substrate-binding protein